MRRVAAQETPKQSHTRVITRSRRKNSLLAQDTDEGPPATKAQSQNRKRAQIGEETVDSGDFEELQSLFASFVEALNLRDTETISDRVKRGTRRKMLSNASEDVSNVPTRSLKRVKRESRKAKTGKKAKEDSKKTSKKIHELEPIEEDVKKENLVNGEDSTERRKPVSEADPHTARPEPAPDSQAPEVTQLQAAELDSKKQILDNNFNGKIPVAR